MKDMEVLTDLFAIFALWDHLLLLFSLLIFFFCFCDDGQSVFESSGHSPNICDVQDFMNGCLEKGITRIRIFVSKSECLTWSLRHSSGYVESRILVCCSLAFISQATTCASGL